MTEDKDNSARNWGVAGIVTSVLVSTPSWIDPIRSLVSTNLGSLAPMLGVIYPFAMVAIGFFTGWQFRKWNDGKPRKPTRRELREAEERDRAEYRQAERRLYEQIKTLDPSLKAMLSVLARGGTVHADRRGWDSSHYLNEPWLSQFCEKATVDGGEYEVTASDLLGRFVEMYPDALDGCERTAGMHVMRPGVAAMLFDEGYGILQWYWRGTDDAAE